MSRKKRKDSTRLKREVLGVYPEGLWRIGIAGLSLRPGHDVRVGPDGSVARGIRGVRARRRVGRPDQRRARH